MASAHIELKGSESRLASDFRQFIDQLQRVVDSSTKLKAIADQAASGADWAGLRAAFGFSSDAHAEAAYNLLGSVKNTLTTDSFIAQLLSRVG
jgi:hypothetical protein